MRRFKIKWRDALGWLPEILVIAIIIALFVAVAWPWLGGE